MLLSPRRRVIACLLAIGAFAAPSLAAADPQQCVQQSNDGAELRDRHQLLAARQAYRACASEDECPALVRAECDSALEELKAIIPTLVIGLRDEQGRDVLGGTLLLDGNPVAFDGSALEVDPGVHALSGMNGVSRTDLQVMVVERDANRRIDILLEPPKPSSACAAPPQTTCVAASASPRASVAAPQPSSASQPSALLPVYLLGGVAALGATSFAYFALSGHSELRDMDACKPACDPSEVTRVRGKYLAADVSLGVSLAALAGASYFLLSAPRETHAAARKPFSVAITAAPNAAGLSVQWVE
jgi:hypothetical protein